MYTPSRNLCSVLYEGDLQSSRRATTMVISIFMGQRYLLIAGHFLIGIGETSAASFSSHYDYNFVAAA